MYLSRYTKPKLTGVVIKEAVRCGKSNCRCSKGDFHKWYYYLYYRSFENNKWKLKKEYINHNKVKYLKGKIKEMKNREMATKVRLSANAALLKDTLMYSRGSRSADDLLKSVYAIT
jgi:hypothetical protein